MAMWIRMKPRWMGKTFSMLCKTFLILFLIFTLMVNIFPISLSYASSNVGTSTSSAAVFNTLSHKIVYDETNNLWWAFYLSDSSTYVYCYSTNMTIWSSPPMTLWGYSPSARNGGLDVLISGTVIYVTMIDGTSIYFRRGEINGTTITWDSTVVVYSNSYTGSIGGGISQTSTGRLMIPTWTFSPCTGCPQIHFYRNPLYIFYSDNNGTDWSYTSAGSSAAALYGFPSQVYAGSATIISMANGKAMLIYQYPCDLYNFGDALLYYRIWDGSSWSVESILYDKVAYAAFGVTSIVANGDTVDVAWLNSSSTYEILHKRYYGESSVPYWGSVNTVVSTTTSSTRPALLVDGSYTYLFYAFSNHIYYRSYVDGVWSEATDWVSDTLTGNDALSVAYQSWNSTLAILYLNQTSSPFYVKVQSTPSGWNGPSNDDIDTDEVFTKDYYGWVNVTVSDPDNSTNLDYVDLRISTAGGQTFTLRFNETSGVFSETSDIDGICTLGNSVNSSISATTILISFNLTITDPAVWGYCDATVTSRDEDALQDVDAYADLFLYYYVVEFVNLQVSKTYCNASDTLVFNGALQYVGGGEPPNGNYEIKVLLKGEQKGSTDHTLVSGYFEISDVTAESTAGDYVYYASAYGAATSAFPTVAVDKLNIDVLAVPTMVEKGENVTVSWSIKRMYNQSDVTNFNISFTRNDIAYMTDLTNNSFIENYSIDVYYYYDVSSAIDLDTGITAFDYDHIYGIWGIPSGLIENGLILKYDIWLNDLSGQYIGGQLTAYNRTTDTVFATTMFAGTYAPIYLRPYETYYFTVSKDGNIFRSKSWTPTTSDLSFTIDIIQLSLIPEGTWKHFAWAAVRNQTTIYISTVFNESATATVKLYRSNSTLLETWEYANTTGFDESYDIGDNTTQCYAILQGEMPNLGVFKEVKFISDWVAPGDVRMPVSLFTGGWFDPQLISCLLVVAVGLTVTTRFKGIGVIIMAGMMVFFFWAGWLQVSEYLLAICVVMAVLGLFSMRRS